MKWLKRSGIVILTLPIIILAIWGAYEILGMCVNRNAAKKQTETLQTHLQNEISDVEIMSLFYTANNTSGTGNHVECLSSVEFSTKMQETEIKNRLSKYYVFDGQNARIQLSNDNYTIYVITSAPFADNIMGH